MCEYTNVNSSIYEVGVATTVEEVERTRAAWRQFQKHPNADIDFYLTVVEARPSILRPHVVAVKSNGSIVAMAVGRIEESEFALKLGYKSLWKPKVKSLVIVQGGLLGNCSGRVSELLMSELLGVLKRHEVDVIALDALPADCDVVKSAQKHGRLQQSFSSAHLSLRSPKNSDELLNKFRAKGRGTIRRLPRTLERDYPGCVVYRRFTSKEETDKLVRDAEMIAKRTYQRGLGVGFIDDYEHRKRLALCASKGWLRAYLVYIHEKPCAFWIWTKYGQTLYSDFMGYDPRYKKYSLGTMLFFKILEWIQSDHIDTIDFGLGDASYKQRFGDHQWEDITIYIYAPTIKSKALYISKWGISHLSFLMRTILKKTKLLEKVKKVWRGRLRRKLIDSDA